MTHTHIMSRHSKPTREDLTNLKRLINSGINNVLQYGEEGTMDVGRYGENTVDSKTYCFADKDYRVYDYFMMYRGFEEYYRECVMDCVTRRFPGMQFEVQGGVEEGMYDEEQSWGVSIEMESAINPDIQIEVRHTVWFARDALPRKIPDSGYTFVRVLGWKRIPSGLQ